MAESLAAALEREHREIDQGIEAFVAAPSSRDAGPLTGAIRALRRHIYLEEEFLFPALHDAGLQAPVFVMLREHAQLWQALDALERDLADGTPEQDMLAACHRLTVALQHHNLKEERVLYPRVADVLTEPASDRLREFLDAGELPAGWVCLRARA